MGMPIKYIVFTDASRRKGQSGRAYCGYGVAVLNIKTKQYVTFGGELSARSVVFCEAWAIYQGLVKVAEIIADNKPPKGEQVQALVVTDSKLNVEILSRYIPYSWDLSDWEHWKKQDGTPVKNQDLYRRIVTFMKTHTELHARITHVNSHLTDKEWLRTKRKLRDYGINVRKETAQMFMGMNAIVDQIAQDTTTTMRDREEREGLYFRLERRRDAE